MDDDFFNLPNLPTQTQKVVFVGCVVRTKYPSKIKMGGNMVRGTLPTFSGSLKTFLFFIFKDIDMLKTIISLILIILSSVSMAKLHIPDQEPLPARLTDTQETIGQYTVYGTKGDGFGVLDGRKQDGKVVEMHFLATLLGRPMMSVIPAKKWSDIPEYQKDFDDDNLNINNKTFYLLDCVQQTAHPHQIQIHQAKLKQIPLKTIAFNQLQGVEKAASDYLCSLLLSFPKKSS